jgi:hypothetical protein
MKNSILFILLFLSINVFSQEKKWRFSILYGMEYNFFVDYGFKNEIIDGYNQPVNRTISLDFIQKKPLGIQYGFVLSYVNQKNHISLSYERGENVGVYKGSVLIDNVSFSLDNYKIHHVNNYFSMFIKHNIYNKGKLYWKLGWYYLNSQQEEIAVINNSIQLIERTAFNGYKNAYLGLLFGLDVNIYSCKYYDIQLVNNIYYTISTSQLESFFVGPNVVFYF